MCNVQTELIKYSPDIIHQYIADILNQVTETGKYPEEIKLEHLMPQSYYHVLATTLHLRCWHPRFEEIGC